VKKANRTPARLPERGHTRCFTGSSEGVPAEWAENHRLLLRLRERLLEDRTALLRDTEVEAGADGTHPADIATDEMERDLHFGLLSAGQDALLEIEEALRRIERGTYGICELTGKRIPKARLRAAPWTRFTVEAEAALEKQGLANRTHLGDLGRVEVEPQALSRELDEIAPPEREAATEAVQRRSIKSAEPDDEEAETGRDFEAEQAS
jgi:RNA polymerase-binding transcription factor DksA